MTDAFSSLMGALQSQLPAGHSLQVTGKLTNSTDANVLAQQQYANAAAAEQKAALQQPVGYGSLSGQPYGAAPSTQRLVVLPGSTGGSSSSSGSGAGAGTTPAGPRETPGATTTYPQAPGGTPGSPGGSTTPGGSVTPPPSGPPTPPVFTPNDPGITTPPGPDTGPNQSQVPEWFNPYTGKVEAIPGLGPNGAVRDAGAFWAYWDKYKNPGLFQWVDAVTKSGNGVYDIMAKNDPSYIGQLGNLNLGRLEGALNYGDTTPFGGDSAFTPEQLNAIRNNPASQLATLLRNLGTNRWRTENNANAHGSLFSGGLDTAQQMNSNSYETGKYNAAQSAGVKGQGFDNTQSTDYGAAVAAAQKAAPTADPHYIIQTTRDTAQGLLDKAGTVTKDNRSQYMDALWQAIQQYKDVLAGTKELANLNAEYTYQSQYQYWEQHGTTNQPPPNGLPPSGGPTPGPGPRGLPPQRN